MAGKKQENRAAEEPFANSGQKSRTRPEDAAGSGAARVRVLSEQLTTARLKYITFFTEPFMDEEGGFVVVSLPPGDKKPFSRSLSCTVVWERLHQQPRYFCGLFFKACLI